MRKCLPSNDPLRKSLVASVSRLYDMNKDEIRETKKYTIAFRFHDKGRYFKIVDKKTKKEYYVESFEDRSESIANQIIWGVYPIEKSEARE